MTIEYGQDLSRLRPVTIMPDGPQGTKVTLAVPNDKEGLQSVKEQFKNRMDQLSEGDRRDTSHIISIANDLGIPIIE